MEITKSVPFYLPRVACLCLAAVLASCAPQAQRMPVPTGPKRGRCGFRGALAPLLRRSARASACDGHRARRPSLRRQARRRGRRRPRAPADARARAAGSSPRARRRTALARASGGRAAARERLEYDAWSSRSSRTGAGIRCVYTELAGDSLYGLLARDFAPLPRSAAERAARAWTSCRGSSRRCARRSIRRACRRSTPKPPRSRTPA